MRTVLYYYNVQKLKAWILISSQPMNFMQPNAFLQNTSASKISRYIRYTLVDGMDL